jgi:hypothetical protein
MSVAHAAADAYPDPAEARADERMAVLREMAQIGLRIARNLEREVEAAVSAPPAAAEAKGSAQAQAQAQARRADEVARAFAQVARAVSLAVALQEKIEQDRDRRPLEAETLLLKRRALAVRTADQESESRVTRRRALVAGAVEQVIEADPAARSPQRAADLRTRLDRLLACEAADFDVFLHRPAGVIVAHICRELGLEPDWTLWDAPWAAQAQRAAAAAPPGARASSSGLTRGPRRGRDAIAPRFGPPASKTPPEPADAADLPRPAPS